MREIYFNQALREALREEMARDERVFLMGEDIGLYGGVFKVTEGLMAVFGPARVRETPISEAGFVGAAAGAAITGKRPVVELMFMDFAYVAADSIFNQVAKMRYMSGGRLSVPMVIRTQQGGGRGNGAQHSQSLEALFAHIPGLKVVAPSNPYDAKGLLKSAIRDDDPVVFIEHKMLYPTRGRCLRRSTWCPSAMPRSSAAAATSRWSATRARCCSPWPRRNGWPVKASRPR